MDLDIERLKGWIGREETSGEALTPALVARFNATFDRTSSSELGAIAPMLIHFCLGQPAVPTADLGPDGHPARGGFLPPVPLPRRMWAGGVLEVFEPIRIGGYVSRRSVIEDVSVKQGRSGTLCFVTLWHHVDCDGQHALTERQDIVYRDAPAPSEPDASGTPHPAPEGAHRVQLTVAEPLLFRYSALTFNGHRIHYDSPYARTEELYPGLVIHGPLQATMLCQYAADLRGSAPRHFSFRSLAPIFGPGEMILHATPNGDAWKLWTSQPGGPISMEATAEW